VAMSPRLFLDKVKLPELPPETENKSTQFGPRRPPGERVAAAEKKVPAKADATSTSAASTAGGE
jgi:hypothetical protein